MRLRVASAARAVKRDLRQRDRRPRRTGGRLDGGGFPRVPGLV